MRFNYRKRSGHTIRKKYRCICFERNYKLLYRTDAMIGLLFDKLKYYKVTLSAAILINMIKECAVFLESVDRKQNEINDNAQRIKGSTETSFQEEYQQIIALFTEIYAQCEASFITLSADMNLLAISDI